MSARPLTAAERQRQCKNQQDYRDRRKTGVQSVRTYPPPDLVEDLINAGLLPQREAENKMSIGEAVLETALLWARNRGGKNSC